MTTRLFRSAALAVFASSMFFAAACGKTPAADGSSGVSGTSTSTTTGASDCPKDELGAIGKACSQDGKTCGASPSGARFIMCSRGKWTEMSAPPPPPPPTNLPPPPT